MPMEKGFNMTKKEQYEYDKQVHLDKIKDHGNITFAHLGFVEDFAKAFVAAPERKKVVSKPLLVVDEVGDDIIIRLVGIKKRS